MRTAIAVGKVFEEHTTGVGHPERPERVACLRELVARARLARSVVWLPLREATNKELRLVHDSSYIARVEHVCQAGGGVLDRGDTIAGPSSFRVARVAVGTVLGAVDAVLGGDAGAAFCAVRPPGHHALAGEAMGFCIFNNVALGAAYALEKHGIRRVFILDWDVHHGNGTQDVFYGRRDVFYCSLHRWPYYPGSGSAAETGEGEGDGCTLNVPLPAGSDESAYLAALKENVVPALQRYGPQLVMISAGFDPHKLDPLGGMALESSSFGTMSRILVEAAGVGVVSVLEGGYHLDALVGSVEAHLTAFLE